MRTLVTRRLVLEPQLAEHAEAMYALLQDPAIYRYENEPPHSVDGLRERFRRLESRASADGSEHWLNWVVRLRDAELTGYVQATVCEASPAAIAYWKRALEVNPNMSGVETSIRATEQLLAERRRRGA